MQGRRVSDSQARAFHATRRPLQQQTWSARTQRHQQVVGDSVPVVKSIDTCARRVTWTRSYARTNEPGVRGRNVGANAGVTRVQRGSDTGATWAQTRA